MTGTPPVQAAPVPAIDPNVLAAALAQLQANNNAAAKQLPSVPKFVYDPAKPNGASLWFDQLESLFRLKALTDEEKCALAVNALDSSTFEKVARALLPDQIKSLDDFQKLKDAMLGLFDFSVSTFAKRYSALNLEWKGPEYESIAELGARIKDLATAFAGVKDAEMETLMLMLSMKDPALEFYRTQVLKKLTKQNDTPLDECLETMTSFFQTQREQKLPVTGSINFIQKKRENTSLPATSRRRRPSASSRASSNASTSSRRGSCDSCGGHHSRSQCRFRKAECYSCGKNGHIKKVCKAKTSSTSKTSATHIQTVRVSPDREVPIPLWKSITLPFSLVTVTSVNQIFSHFEVARN